MNEIQWFLDNLDTSKIGSAGSPDNSGPIRALSFPLVIQSQSRSLGRKPETICTLRLVAWVKQNSQPTFNSSVIWTSSLKCHRSLYLLFHRCSEVIAAKCPVLVIYNYHYCCYYNAWCIIQALRVTLQLLLMILSCYLYHIVSPWCSGFLGNPGHPSPPPVQCKCLRSYYIANGFKNQQLIDEFLSLLLMFFLFLIF